MSDVATFDMAQNAPSPSDDEKLARLAAKKTSKREMQIYKPPGLRSGGAENSAVPPVGTISKGSPIAGAGQKPPNELREESKGEENNNVRDSSSRGSSSAASKDERRLNRTESSLSSESGLSQRSAGSSGARGSIGGGQPLPEKKKLPSPPRKEVKKKVMTPRDIADVSTSIRALHMATNAAELEQWIAGSFSCPVLGECVGSALCQHAIEGGGGRGVAKICGALKEVEGRSGMEKGLLTSISQYFECRDKLRADHFRMWISFLNFVSDLYSNLGGGDGELVSFVFRVFDYLLRPPVLESLKIEELESLISSLLSVGYELERECPDQLSLLKDLIRDAFISVTEPWARKMILLLLELGASGWKLPPEANEYYFQQAGS